jgi:hypothetical protein
MGQMVWIRPDWSCIDGPQRRPSVRLHICLTGLDKIRPAIRDDHHMVSRDTRLSQQAGTLRARVQEGFGDTKREQYRNGKID